MPAKGSKKKSHLQGLGSEPEYMSSGATSSAGVGDIDEAVGKERTGLFDTQYHSCQ